MKTKNCASGAHRHESGKPRNLITAVARILVLTALVIVVGCRDNRYRVRVAADEAVFEGQPVTHDGVAIGVVERIERNGDTPIAVIRINRAHATAIREGTERDGPGTFNLSNSFVKPGAPPLKDGAFITTRSAPKHAIKALSGALSLVCGNARLALLIVVVGMLLLLVVARVPVRVVGVAVLIIILAGVASTAFGAPVARTVIEDNLNRIEASVTRAERGAAEARQYVDAGLTRLADRAAADAFAYSEIASIVDTRTRGDIDRMGFFTNSETIDSLRARYINAATRRVAADAELSQLGLSFVHLLLVNREEAHTMLARDGATAVPELLDRLDHLSKLPKSITDSRIVTLANEHDVTFADGVLTLPDGTHLKTGEAQAKETANAERLAAVERVAADIRASVLQLQLQRDAAPVDESHYPAAPAVENRAQTAATPAPLETEPVKTAPDPQPAEALPRLDREKSVQAGLLPPSSDRFVVPTPVRVGICVALVLVAGFTLLAMSRRRRAVDVGLARIGDGGAAQTVRLIVHHDEAIVLGDGAPRVEPCDFMQPVPAVILVRGGRLRIKADTATVRVGDTTLSDEGADVHVGDEILVTKRAGAGAEKLVLRQISPVAGDEAFNSEGNSNERN